MLPFKLVYHERYDLNLGPHVFPSQKFRLIYELLLHEGIAMPQDFLRPDPATDEDILRVHAPDWVRSLAGDFITRIRDMAKASARLTIWRWRSESCRRMAP